MAVSKARETAWSLVMSTWSALIVADGNSAIRESILGCAEAGFMSKRMRPERPCSKRALLASNPRVPVPPVILYRWVSGWVWWRGGIYIHGVS